MYTLTDLCILMFNPPHQIDVIQERMGRVALDYDYARAAIVTGHVSINGRFWSGTTDFDFVQRTRHDRGGGTLGGGLIQDFVVVHYTHKNVANMRGRFRPSRLQGELMFVRARQYNPTPTRVGNLWVAVDNPAYRLETQVVCMHDLCGFLHTAEEQNGRPGFTNLVTVSTAFPLHS
jgi:hypothetical protein